MTAVILLLLVLLLLALATVRAVVRGDLGSAAPPASHYRDPRFGAPSARGH